MRKTMLLLASTALITVSTLAAPALARDRDRDRGERSEVTANQLINQADAQTARMKAELRLTPAQEKDWSAFEDARHQAATRRADRAMAMQAADKAAHDAARDADRAARDAPRTTDGNATVGKATATDGTTPPAAFTLLDRINADADAQIARANDWKKLAEAARPLYTSLDDRQQRRFAELLFRGDHDRDRERNRDRERDDR